MDAVAYDIERRIRRIAAARGELPHSIKIYHDLYIAGDDAAELLQTIAKDYGTSFDGFKFSDYFPGELDAAWLYLAGRLGFPDRKRKSFTIGHLVSVVKQGAWFDPPITGTQ